MNGEKIIYGMGIAVVVVLLVASVFFLVQRMKGSLETGQEANATAQQVQVENNFVKCAREQNVSAETVIYYYNEQCEDCTEMIPIVQSVEVQGAKFYWGKATEVKPKFFVITCYIEVVSGIVPEFICAGTGETKTGKISEEELKAFTQSCAQNAKIR